MKKDLDHDEVATHTRRLYVAFATFVRRRNCPPIILGDFLSRDPRSRYGCRHCSVEVYSFWLLYGSFAPQTASRSFKLSRQNRRESVSQFFWRRCENAATKTTTNSIKLAVVSVAGSSTVVPRRNCFVTQTRRCCLQLFRPPTTSMSYTRMSTAISAHVRPAGLQTAAHHNAQQQQQQRQRSNTTASSHDVKAASS